MAQSGTLNESGSPACRAGDLASQLLLSLMILLTLCSRAVAGQIVAAEDFFDVDPGWGYGVVIPVVSGEDVAVDVALPVRGLDEGRHMLFLRFQDKLGRWSLADGRVFYVNEDLGNPQESQIVAAEYFIDEDPGQGAGSGLVVTAGSEISVTAQVVLGELDPGLHRFYLRLLDEEGHWSIADCRLFYHNELMPTSEEHVLGAAEYFINIIQVLEMECRSIFQTMEPGMKPPRR
jgi:hypothetical protein